MTKEGSIVWRLFSPRRDLAGELSPWPPLAAWVLVASIVWLVVVARVGGASPGFDVLLSLASLPIGLAMVAGYVIAAKAMVGPAGFRVREGVAFVIPQSRNDAYLVSGQISIVAFLSGMQMMRSADTGRSVVAEVFSTVVLVLLVLLVPLAAATLAAAIQGRPSVLFTPRALIVLDSFGSRTIPWEALGPGTPQRPHPLLALKLTIVRPELVASRGLVMRNSSGTPLALSRLGVHPWFIADAIRFYVDHPDRRAAIGTSAEHERLLSDLGVTAEREATQR
jgi:hypothetical protein